MSTTPNEGYMLAKEVAAMFRISARQVTRLAEKGQLPGVRIGTLWRFKKAELLEWAKQRHLPSQTGVPS